MIGAFNCQGAGWDPKERRIKGHPECYKPMTGSVHAKDIEWDQKIEATWMGEALEYAVYLDQAEDLFLVTPTSDPIEITIQPSTFEIFSFVPIKKLGPTAKFAPIGLTNMFNSGGTLQELEYNDTGVGIRVKGGGSFLAYSTEKPNKCYLNGTEVDFEWGVDGKLTLSLPWIEEAGGISDVGFVF